MQKQRSSSSGKRGGDLYIILWEFHVRTGREERFEQVYGRDGGWARFFGQGKGYLGTELCRDIKRKGRYLTADYWVSQAAYDTFRRHRLEEYQALDQQCETLTERETSVGTFVCHDAAQRPARTKTAAALLFGGKQ